MSILAIKKWWVFALCLMMWINTLAFNSGIATGSLDTQAPTAPTKLSASDITRTSFTLNWTASTDNVGVKEYRVYRNDKLLASSSNNSYPVATLNLNTTYKMRVVAFDQAGNPSKSSATISVKTLADNIPPHAPTDLQASNVSMQSFQLHWQAATDDVGVTRYEVYVDGVLRTTNRIVKNILSTSATITGLKPDTSYIVMMNALDNMSNRSEASLPLVVETLSDTLAPLPVTGLAADILKTDGFRLMWDRTQDNLRMFEYEVFRNGVSLGKTKLNQWTLSGLQPATTYAMTVVAYDESGNASPIRQTLSVKTIPSVQARLIK